MKPALVPFLTLAICGLAAPPASSQAGCGEWDPSTLRENPSEAELRCRHGVRGPGRFGLLSYVDVPVYQPATPMPGTHIVGVAGHARPAPGESWEHWEWRILRTPFDPAAIGIRRELDLLHPFVASRVMALEEKLARSGIPARRRETWRSPERQGYLFQSGRSRPGPIATATLTSWHSVVDSRGNPAGRAVDYDVPAWALLRFHEMVAETGLASFGHDSNDPGHVYLPDPEALPPIETALLRVLPRVPEVTLATGLPVDRELPEGGMEELRDAARNYLPPPGGLPRAARPWAEPVLTVR